MTALSKREMLDWLHQRADACGECDRCHAEGALWSLPEEIDRELDAQWMYCAACFRKLVIVHFHGVQKEGDRRCSR